MWLISSRLPRDSTPYCWCTPDSHAYSEGRDAALSSGWSWGGRAKLTTRIQPQMLR